mmetsp:Transcript_96542/g.300257  ORF Transcript_96542/g.300257 Transcript_96542/m.300257 type:complete len:344 (+) Transcript_96542:91-1122(+)
MPRVGLVFELRRADALPGESIRVMGDWPELGSWDSELYANVDAAPQLLSTASMLPRWAMAAPVWLTLPGASGPGPSSQPASPMPNSPGRQEDQGAAGRARVLVEYKFARDRRSLPRSSGPPVVWEDEDIVRNAALPLEDGSIWLISDAAWNACDERARVARTTPAELLARWRGKLGPERLARPPAPAGEAEPATFALTPRTGTPERARYAIEDEFQFRPAPCERRRTYPLHAGAPGALRGPGGKRGAAGRRVLPPAAPKEQEAPRSKTDKGLDRPLALTGGEAGKPAPEPAEGGKVRECRPEMEVLLGRLSCKAELEKLGLGACIVTGKPVEVYDLDEPQEEP